MRIRKQINNLKIKFSENYNKYQVETPDKKILEEFDTLEKAAGEPVLSQVLEPLL